MSLNAAQSWFVRGGDADHTVLSGLESIGTNQASGGIGVHIGFRGVLRNRRGIIS